MYIIYTHTPTQTYNHILHLYKITQILILYNNSFCDYNIHLYQYVNLFRAITHDYTTLPTLIAFLCYSILFKKNG